MGAAMTPWHRAALGSERPNRGQPIRESAASTVHHGRPEGIFVDVCFKDSSAECQLYSTGRHFYGLVAENG